jgi:hypothetical protein
MKMNKRTVSGCILLVVGCLYLIGCGESSHRATTFRQSDLTGTWYFIKFASGPGVTAGTEPGWKRGTATIDATGNVTVEAGTLIETIDSTGVVTETGSNAMSENHAVMANNKQIVVGTGNTNDNRVMRIFVKQVPGVTFFDADITGPISLVLHELCSGSSNIWYTGTGTINNQREITLTIVDPTGPAGARSGTINIESDGIVTLTNNDTFQGMMIPDKKTIFGTQTINGSFCLSIMQVTGQTFTQADMAGTSRNHNLVTSATTPFWEYDTYSITSAGVVTNEFRRDSRGNTTTVSESMTAILDSSGKCTMPINPSYNCYMSYYKDMGIATGTWGGENRPEYTLIISLTQ